MAADIPVGVWEGLEQQTTSPFLSLFISCSIKVNCRHHDFGIDYTTSQNASPVLVFWESSGRANLDVLTRKKCRASFLSRNFSRNYQARPSGYIRMESSYDGISACRFSRQPLGIVLWKLRLAYVNKGLESPIAGSILIISCTQSDVSVFADFYLFFAVLQYGSPQSF